MNVVRPRITGVVLAGGQGSRLNYQDKPLMDLGGKPIIEHIVENAQGQVDQLLLNVNRNAEKYGQIPLPVIGDCTTGFAGPLAGVYSAMQWCDRHDPETSLIACFPGDVPWFPRNIVEQLLAAMQSSASETAWLRTDGQVQPLFSLWSMSLRSKLAAALERKVYSPMQFILCTRHVLLDVDGGPENHFLNINDPDDLEKARQMAGLATASLRDCEDSSAENQ